jgi:hypothetical protein
MSATGNDPLVETSRLDSMEIKMSDDTEDCKACFGKGNEARMRSPQPGQKILFRPCPSCIQHRERGTEPRALIIVRPDRWCRSPGAAEITRLTFD